MLSTAASPRPRTRYRAELDDALLAAGAALVARGIYPAVRELALELGEPNATSTVRRHLNSLVYRGLWPWEVRDPGVRGPNCRKGLGRTGDDDPTRVRQRAADIYCTEHAGQAHPLKDDERPWAGPWRARPAPADTAREAALRSRERAEAVRRYIKEFKRIRRGLGASGRTKRCSRCGETKPVGSFTADPTMADGFRSACRECEARRWRERRRRTEGVARVRRDGTCK